MAAFITFLPDEDEDVFGNSAKRKLDILEPALQFDILTENQTGHNMDWTSYHRAEDIYGYLNYLADKYPQNFQLISIGSSSGGLPLYVGRISSASSGSKPAKPAIWIDGGNILSM